MSDHVVETHPVQLKRYYSGDVSVCPRAVTMAAYEVYCHVSGAQPALVTGNCRGGFSKGELIAFLYARAFPKSEWRVRVYEAFQGAKNLD
jgi:hypothetical protein